MTSATALLHLKLVQCCCATTVPRTNFTAISKPSCSIRQIHFSPSSISLKSKNLPFNIVPFVAQTSDWAQQDEANESGSTLLEGDVENVDDAGNSLADPPEEAKLFVGNLPYDVDSEKLAALFNQAGVVEISEV